MNESKLMPRFWYLCESDAPFRRVELVSHNARDLRDEIFGRPAASDWNPPEYRIHGSGKWPDWMRFPIPLLSKSGVSAIGSLIESGCELLPWIKEPNHDYYLVNVLERIPRNNWSCETSTEYGGVLATADSITIHGMEIPPIFILDDFPRRVFVSDAVARASVEAELTGAVFVDPSVKRIHVSFIQGVRKIYSGFIRREDDF